MNLDEYPITLRREEGHRQEPRGRARGAHKEPRPHRGAVRHRGPHADPPLRDRRRPASEQRGRWLQPARPLQEGPVVHQTTTGSSFELADVVGWHIDHLAKMYPELEEHRDDVAKVLAVEASRYASTVQRVSRTVAALAASKKEHRRRRPCQALRLGRHHSGAAGRGRGEGGCPRGLLPAGGRQARLPEARAEAPGVRHVRPPRDPGCSTTRTARSSSSKPRS